MKKRTGLYRSVQVDAAACGVVSQAGGVALLETARVSGLDRLLSRSLEPWRAPRAVHDPAKVLLDLAVTLALGGDCLADVAVLRGEPGVYGHVASDPTVSRTIDTLAKDAPRALAAINAARAAARAAVWRLAGAHAPDSDVSAEHPLVVDIDATLVTSHSDKENARPTFKRGFGHHRCGRSPTTAQTAPASHSRCCSARVMPGATPPPTTSLSCGRRCVSFPATAAARDGAARCWTGPPAVRPSDPKTVAEAKRARWRSFSAARGCAPMPTMTARPSMASDWMGWLMVFWSPTNSAATSTPRPAWGVDERGGRNQTVAACCRRCVGLPDVYAVWTRTRQPGGDVADL